MCRSTAPHQNNPVQSVVLLINRRQCIDPLGAATASRHMTPESDRMRSVFF
jgi:hypothetical protein